MNGMTKLLALLAATAALAACGGSHHSDGNAASALPARFQGTWGNCFNLQGGGTAIITGVVSGTTATITRTDYATADCTGAATPRGTTTQKVTAGATVQATLNAAAVSAVECDWDAGTANASYDLCYVDEALNPDRFYQGLSDAAHDGSTPAKRPVALDPGLYYDKQ